MSSLFELLYADYQTSPPALALPGEVETVTALFDTAKLEIVTALDHGDVNRAETCLALAWAIAAQTGNPEHDALAHWCSGLAYINREPRRALDHFLNARDFYTHGQRAEEEGRVLIGIAGLLGQFGRLEEAEGAINRADTCLMRFPTYRGRPALYINRSDIEGRLGRYSEMLASAIKGEAIAREMQQTSNTARSLINQAVALTFLGEINQAESALVESLSLSGSSPELQGRTRLNQARLAIYGGRLFQALQLLRLARDHFVKAGIEIDQATASIEEANVFERLAMPSEARRSATRAAMAFEREPMPSEAGEAYLTSMRLSIMVESPQEARVSLDHFQRLDARTSPTLQSLATAYSAHPIMLERAQYRDAITRVEQAVGILSQQGAIHEELEARIIAANLILKFNKTDAMRQYELIAGAARSHALVQLEQQACAAQARIYGPTRKAIPLLRRMADLLAEIHGSIPVEELKANLLTGSRRVHRDLILSYLKTRQPDLATSALLEAKGTLWAELAGDTDVVPPDAAWVRAKAELTYWRDEMSAATYSEYAALCKLKVHLAEASLVEAARRQVRVRQPRNLPEPSAICKDLSDSAAVVDYVVTDTELFACVFSRTLSPAWHSLGNVDKVRTLLSHIGLLIGGMKRAGSERQTLAQRQRPMLDQLLSQLSALLITPLMDAIGSMPQWIIVPDDFLHDVPWAALRIGDMCLGQSHALVLLPSSTLVVAGETDPLSHLPGLALGHAGYPPLAHIDAELNAIQNAAPDACCVHNASLQHLTWDTPPRWLHIAAHGRVNRASPLLSELVLADGVLLLADALNLSLRGAELVTLSACETGAVPEQGGVALAFSGVFLLAGARTVLASLWQVDDEATSILMAELYAHLQAGQNLTIALQLAQAHLIGTAQLAHPFYWAAFQTLSRAI